MSGLELQTVTATTGSISQYNLVHDQFKRRTSLKVVNSRSLIAILPTNTDLWRSCKQSLRLSQDTSRKIVNDLTSLQVNLDCYARTIAKMSFRVKTLEQEGEEFSADYIQSDQERIDQNTKQVFELLKRLEGHNDVDVVTNLWSAQDALWTSARRDQSNKSFIQRFSKTIENINETYAIAKAETDKLIGTKVELQNLTDEEKEISLKIERVNNSIKQIQTQIDKLECESAAERTEYGIKIKLILEKCNENVKIMEDELRNIEKKSDDHIRRIMNDSVEFEAKSLMDIMDAPAQTGSSLRVLFLLDASGSMEGEPWNQQVRCFEDFVNYRRSDLITVVLFSGDAKVLSPNVFSQATGGGVVKLPLRCPGGSTSFSSAFEAIENLIEPGKPTAIILTTDGQANSKNDVRKAVASGRNMKRINKDLKLFAIGLGNYVDFSELKEMVEAVNNGLVELPGNPPCQLIYSASDLGQFRLSFENIGRTLDRAMLMEDHVAKAEFLNDQLSNLQEKTKERLDKTSIAYKTKIKNMREKSTENTRELEMEMEKQLQRSQERVLKLKSKMEAESEVAIRLTERLSEINRKKLVNEKEIEVMSKKTSDISNMVNSSNDKFKQEFQQDIEQMVKSLEESNGNMAVVGCGVNDTNSQEIGKLLEIQTNFESISNIEIHRLIVFARSIASEATAFESDLSKLSKPKGRAVSLWDRICMKLIQDDCISLTNNPVQKFLNVVSYLIGEEYQKINEDLKQAISKLLDGVQMVEFANETKTFEEEELKEWLKTRVVKCKSGSYSESELTTRIAAATKALTKVKKEEEEEVVDEDDLDESELKARAKKKIQQNRKIITRKSEEEQIEKMKEDLEEINERNNRLKVEVKNIVRQVTTQIKNLLHTTCEQKQILRVKELISNAEVNIGQRSLVLMKIIEEYKDAIQEGLSRQCP